MVKKRTDWKKESGEVENLIKKQKTLLREGKKKKSFFDNPRVTDWILFICFVIILVGGVTPVWIYWVGGLMEEKLAKLDVLKNLDKLENLKDPCQCDCKCYEKIIKIENVTETKIFVVENNTLINKETFKLPS